MMYVIVALFAAALTVLAVTALKKPEVKRFGLKEAEAAAGYVDNNKFAAKAVMGVVCGALKYEDRVAEDMQKVTGEQKAESTRRDDERKTNDAKIRELEAANYRLNGAEVAAINFVADKAKVAALFQS